MARMHAVYVRIGRTHKCDYWKNKVCFENKGKVNCLLMTVFVVLTIKGVVD